MLILSISLGLTNPTPQLTASDSTTNRSSFLLFSFSFFESFSHLFLKSLGRITEAATTGPARHPLPASSQPASL